ncbi:MAG TPA: zinc ribbon domain-containing protein [Gemmatimonadaceae bacterium]|nr:zinc ribbon domain-containing protein [Gemmatimonadaceae bacterium]
MPTYEFTCPKGHDFDKFFRSMASAPTVVPCPVCGEPAERQMSAGAGLVFHGTGFYITDYGKDGKKDQKSAGRRTSESSKEAAPAASSGEGSTSGGSSASGSDSASSGSSPTEAKSGGEASPKASETPAKPVTPTKASE